MMKLFVVCHLVFQIISISHQETYDQYSFEEVKTAFPCHSLSNIHPTCGKCIRQHPTCAWCKTKFFALGEPHSQCDTAENLEKNGCKKSNIVNPKAKLVSDNIGKSNAQIQPKELHFTIRPKQDLYFNVTIRHTPDYPVDLYYLMDLSKSMSDDKDKVADLANDLVKGLTELTRNARVAFGSFVDKRVTPFYDMDNCLDRKRCQKCKDPPGNCVPAYVFKHELDFTTDYNLLQKSVRGASISKSVDPPEAGLEAMMQVLACQKELKWRDKARKIILYSSDSAYHFSGDGKFAGIITPNDGKCHMIRDYNGDHKYQYDEDYSLKQDYPSVGQIHKKLRENQTNVIFAVTHRQIPLYEALAQALNQSVQAVVGELKDESQNIVDLVKEQYKSITKNLRLDANSADSHTIRYSSKLVYCPNNSTELPTNCDNVPIGEEAVFEVTFRQSQYDPGHPVSWWVLNPVGVSELLSVKLETIQQCECGDEEESADECSGHKYKCGSCYCPEGKYGEKCECNTPRETATAESCRRTPEADICEGYINSNCICGQCHCYNSSDTDKLANYGKFCECAARTCPKDQHGNICSGNGVCLCGDCDCFEGYEGSVCDCESIKNEQCLSATNVVCNGQGKCNCGKCECEGGYSGPLCGQCDTCPDECTQRAKCVNCFFNNRSNKEACKECIQDPIFLPDPHSSLKNDTMKHCSVEDENNNNCHIEFTYSTLDNKQLWIANEHVCVQSAALAIILGIVAGIVLIGLLLFIIGKVCIDRYDKREVAQFKEQLKDQKFAREQNPLFKSATTTHTNPRYRPSTHRQQTIE